MPRLFVAIEPPEAVKARLLELMEGVAGARWQTEEQLHLTVRFIGDVDRHQAEDSMAVLSTLSHPAIDLMLDGAGLFGRRGQPQALWIGVSPQAPLKTLHNKVDQALVRTGLAPEGRAYRPHITLARFGRDAGPLSSFMARHGGITGPPFRASDLCLYESHLTNAGAVYSILDRYPLR